MQSTSPSYSSLQELIVTDQIYKDKSLTIMSFIMHLESMQSYGTPSTFLMTRPRGFGLSLLTTSLDKILKKDAEVTNKIEDRGILDNIQQRHTLIIDFKKVNGRTPKEFKDSLIDTLQERFWFHHIESHINPYLTPKVYFARLIEELYKRHNESMVILIDNYDIPLEVAAMMEHEDNRIESTCAYLDMLNVIKYSKNKVRWALLSGHVKFTLASEYSEGLPLIYDLSNDERYETMFGFTRKEVSSLFADKIAKFADNLNITPDEYIDLLEQCYGGFHFSDNLQPVMCPACISHLMANNGLLLPYSGAGKYTFLSKYLKQHKDDLNWLYDKDGQDPLFSESIDRKLKGKQLGSLLIQLGFATRTNVLANTDEGYTTWRYRFSFPNLDMKKTFDLITEQCPSSDLTKVLPLDIFKETKEDNEEPLKDND